MDPDQRKIALYAAAVFMSSALLLVLEIVAARLIAPYVGVSLYTWSAVIGVVLAGLSVGNAIGGAWADRQAAAGAAGAVLAAAGLSALVIPWLLLLTAEGLQQYQLSILSTSLILVLALFLLPAILIGIVTPLLTTLALAHSRRTGHIVGMMHALAATGSIIGTFAAAWWLIPALGSRNVVLTSGLLLLALGPGARLAIERQAPCAADRRCPDCRNRPRVWARCSIRRWPHPASARAVTSVSGPSTKVFIHSWGMRAVWYWITCCTAPTWRTTVPT